MELRRSVITGGACACAAIMADRTALGPVRRAAARAAGLSTRTIRWAATADASATGSSSTRCCSSCGSAAPTRRSPTRPARPPRSATAATSGSRLGVFARAQADRAGLLRPDRRPRPRPESPSTAPSPRPPAAARSPGASPVDRGKQGLKRSGMTEGYGIPLGRVLAGANRHDSPLLAPTLDRLDDLGPLPDDITVHLDAGYDSDKTRDPARRTRPARPDRAQGREGADPGQPEVARRTDPRLAERLPPPRPLLRAPRPRHRRLLRPRRHDHHRP